MNHISRRPPPEMHVHIHQHGGEIDCQCARCGSSCDSERCQYPGCEDGWIPGDDDDDCYSKPCPQCLGEGGWHRCLSTREWCEANPLPGREGVKRGEIEWYTFDEGGKT